MFLKRTALYIGKWLYEKTPKEQMQKIEKEKEITLTELQNRIKIWLLYLTVIGTLILTTWIFDIWIEMLISLITFMTLRTINGGHHFSIDWCYMITNAVLIGVIPLSYLVEDYGIIVLVVSMIMYIILAPYDTHRETILLKKLTSIIICIISYFAHEVALTMCFVLMFDQIKKRR